MRLPKLSRHAQRRLDRIRSSVLGWLFYPFYLIANFFRWSFGLIGSWWSRRNLRYLFQGLPALLAFTGLAVLTSFGIFQDRVVLAQAYKTKAQESLIEADRARRAKKDAKPGLMMAQTCYQRLAALNDGEAFEHTFGLALTLGELDQPAATDAMMREMGPQNKTGYGPAHLYQARRFLTAAATPGPDGKPQPHAGGLIRLAEQHLQRATQWKSGQTAHQAHKLLAALYQSTNRLPDAERHLREVAEVEPEQKLLLADWARKGGRKEEAERYAAAAKLRFDARLKISDDDLQARVALVQCHMMLGEWAAARALVEKGMTMVNTAEMMNDYRRLMIAVLVAEFDTKENDPKSSPADRYALIERAMNIDPDNPELLQRLLKFTKTTGPEGEKSRKAFKDLVAKGEPSAMAHLFLGIDAWQGENPAEARYHWQKAFDLSKGAPLVANNLAWVMAHFAPIDLPRALEMIDSAIQRSPADARMHGTRGHILAKLGRNEEAFKDLEIAKTAYPNDPNLYKVLGEVCEKLGYKQQAADYKARSEQMLKDAAAKKGGAPAPGPAAPETKSPPASPPPDAPAPKATPSAPEADPKAVASPKPTEPAPKTPAKGS